MIIYNQIQETVTTAPTISVIKKLWNKCDLKKLIIKSQKFLRKKFVKFVEV